MTEDEDQEWVLIDSQLEVIKVNGNLKIVDKKMRRQFLFI